MQVRPRTEQQSGRRRGLRVVRLAAVVAVGADDELVVRLESDAAVAHAQHQGPAIGQFRGGLRVLVEVVDVVDLVALERAPYAEHLRVAGAGEIQEAPAILRQQVVVHAGDQGHGPLADQAAPGPAQVGAAVIRIQVHDAAGVQWIALRRGGKRQELLHLARAAVSQQPQRVGAERVLVDRTQLRLLGALSRVELLGHRRRLLRIVAELVARQAQRILRVRRIEVVADQGELAVGADGEVDLAVERLALGLAVVSITVGLEMRVVEGVVGTAAATAGTGVGAPGPEAAGRKAAADARRLGTVGREQLDHATGGIPVQRRERPAQHLDPVGRREVEVRDLPLPVRLRRRDAVEVQAQPADAERGARAEAANRDLRVLRIVLAIARQQTRHAGQAFGQVHAQRVLVEGFAADDVDGRRHVERGSRDPRRGHRDGLRRADRLEGALLRFGRLRPRGGQRQQHAPGRQPMSRSNAVPADALPVLSHLLTPEFEYLDRRTHHGHRPWRFATTVCSLRSPREAAPALAKLTSEQAAVHTENHENAA